MESNTLVFVCLLAVLEAALVPPNPMNSALVNSKNDNNNNNNNQQEEIGSPLRVAQCRARCLQRFSSGVDKETSCLQGPDCFMCWENCALLQSNYPVWGAMCAEKRICFPGCQQACRFHRETARQQSEPVIQTRGEEVLSLVPLGGAGGGVARWRASAAPRQHHVVYVLMARPAGAASWRQISQSVDLETRLEPGSAALSPDTTVRVLVVDPEGLVTIYSPVTAPTTKQPTAVTSTAALPTKAPAVFISTTTPKIEEEPWKLREVSLLHQRVLVIAEVAWTPRARRGVYLVTWEVDGGGLRGNLFTDSTSVTLSLWPDTIYHIQVELVSRGSGQKRGGVERSEPLIIDTRKAPQVESRPPSPPAAPAVVAEPWGHVTPVELQQRQQQEQQRNQELLAGTGAAMLLFLIVSTAMAWRCHRARSLGRNKRRLLLADDSISAGPSQPIVSVMSAKDCASCPENTPEESWKPSESNPPALVQQEARRLEIPV